jgi:hypothetical protein
MNPNRGAAYQMVNAAFAARDHALEKLHHFSADVARMDWLERHVPIIYTEDGKYCVSLDGNEAAGAGASLREAIDAAMNRIHEAIRK